MPSKAASFIPPFTFPSSSLLLINFILCSRSLRGGLQTWGWGFGSNTSFARIFLFIKELMLVVCLRPLLFGCSKKNKNDVTRHEITYLFFAFRVRKRRSQSVLPGRFSVLKRVPQSICLGSYKACSKKLLCWGRPRPEFQKLAVEKDIHHLQDLYNFQFFALPLQRQPYQGYKQTGINPTRS